MIDELKKISIDAGLKILEIYDKDDFGVINKDDDSPLTKADLASHNVIVNGLRELNSSYNFSYPILSEESKVVEYKERMNWNCYWLIDPLDGTKEFIKRNGEFTVNIALIKNGIPVIGFVYVPVHDTLYYNSEEGAFKIEQAKLDDAFVKKLDHSSEIKDSIRIVASKSHLNSETQNIIEKVNKSFKKTEFHSFGSSLKLCKVADGTADFYPRIAPTMEWDTAAADAICRAADCYVLNYETKQPLEYNKENLLNPYFYVTSSKKVLDIMETI